MCRHMYPLRDPMVFKVLVEPPPRPGPETKSGAAKGPAGAPTRLLAASSSLVYVGVSGLPCRDPLKGIIKGSCRANYIGIL